MKKNQPHRFRPHVEPLEDRRMLAVSVQFDYSRDTGGIFSNAQAKAAFEETVTSIASRLDDTLLAINSSGSNRATASYLDPGGSGSLRTVNNFSIPANTLRIFAGSRNTGSLVGFGGPGGISAEGTPNYFNRALDRGETGVQSSTDVGIWGGSISMNTATNWYFGSSVSEIGDNQVDFRTVVAHELFHMLGFGIELVGSTSSWERLTRNGRTFLGQKARAANGNAFPAISGSHWAASTTTAGAPVLMTDVFDLNTPGVRITPTALDWAALDDLGWEVNSGASAPTITEIDVTAGRATTPSTVKFEFVDINIADRHSAAINWGDGTALTQLSSVTTPFTASHTYSGAGNYSAKVWVTDSSNRTTIEEFAVTIGGGGGNTGGGGTTIAAAAPIISAPGARTSLAGATSRIQFSFTDVNASDSHSAAIDWGDGTALTQLDNVTGTFVASHRYSAAGTYTPIVWVTDSTRRSDRETFTMTVFGTATSLPTPPTTSDIAAPVILPPGNRNCHPRRKRQSYLPILRRKFWRHSCRRNRLGRRFSADPIRFGAQPVHCLSPILVHRKIHSKTLGYRFDAPQRSGRLYDDGLSVTVKGKWEHPYTSASPLRYRSTITDGYNGL